MALLIKKTNDNNLYKPHREGHIKPVCSCTDVKRTIKKSERERKKNDPGVRHDNYLRTKIKNHEPRKKLLSDNEVKKIRNMRKSGIKLVEIHKMYPKCSYTTICKINSRTSYKEVE